MTLSFASMVFETSTSTGNGAVLALSGPNVGYQSFISGVGNGAEVCYSRRNQSDWEISVGIISSGIPDTITRTAVLESSNGGAAVNWPTGEQDVYLVLPLSNMFVKASDGFFNDTYLRNITNGGVIDRGLSAPPGSPSDGDTYIVAGSATGAWSGHDGEIAYWHAISGQWRFISPNEGMTLWVNDEDLFVVFNASTWVNASQKAPTRQYLKSGTSATYTTPDNCKKLLVRMIGGGGGGGGTGTTTTAGAGGNGGNTSFNGIVANGGTGGSRNNGAAGAIGGAGGTGGSGSADLRIPGGSGSAGDTVNGSYGGGTGGAGGNGVFGGGGGGTNTTTAEAGATNSGGGGGAARGTGVTVANSGGGGAGEYVEFSISNPSASYTYTVGTGGTAGTAGTSGNAGAAGGSGLIIVEEYY